MDDPGSRNAPAAVTTRAPAWLRRRAGALFALVTATVSSGTIGIPATPPDPGRDSAAIEIVHSDYRLRNLVLGPDGHVVGTEGSRVYRVVDGGRRLERVARFPALINGLHYMQDGTLVVAVDPVPLDPAHPCRIYLVHPGGRREGPVLELPTATALWWSIASDDAGNLYIGEYGVKRAGLAHRVWKSPDRGRSWEVVFTAPERDGVHIHRVAIDPYTQDLWVTVGDGHDNRGAWRSRDGGANWTLELDSQATGVVFALDAIYWGEDFGRGGRISRLDRATGIATEVLDAGRHGRYGGSVYAMTASADGAVYAPTMKYPMQTHTATLWRGRGSHWRLLAELPAGPDGAVNAESIAGPDSEGWVHMTGLRFRVP